MKTVGSPWGSTAPFMALLALGSGGCEPATNADSVEPECQGVPAQVAGTWVLSGTGSRSGCENDKLDTDRFDLSSAGIAVAQNGDTLQLAEASETFELFGTVAGSCLEFTTVEAVENDSIRYAWSARVTTDARRAQGSFSGSGPENCISSGTFTAEW